MSGRFAEFHDRGCEILGVSTDPVETHMRWLTTPPAQGGLGPIQFSLASDPDGVVCRQYGVYVERQHLALRGIFIIDSNGVLQYQAVHSLSVGRNSNEMLRVLDALQIGGLCPGEREAGQTTIDVLAELGPNRVIGQYEIKRELGSGAFGKVFQARDTLLDRMVALKVLRSNEDVPTASLLAEARAAAALNHLNVCAVHSVETSSGAPMIVMEFVEGQPLDTQLEPGALSPETAADFGRQVAQGMAAAHAVGVVHGDLKPANLMVTPGGTIKIMDFGLARRVPTAQWQAETLVLSASSTAGLSGTPRYMAPELTRGDPPTPASDVFALGLIMYEMLAGRPAVTGNNVFDVLRHIEQFDASRYVAEVPEPFRHLLRESLAATTSERRITMAEIAEQLP